MNNSNIDQIEKINITCIDKIKNCFGCKDNKKKRLETKLYVKNIIKKNLNLLEFDYNNKNDNNKKQNNNIIQNMNNNKNYSCYVNSTVNNETNVSQNNLLENKIINKFNNYIENGPILFNIPFNNTHIHETKNSEIKSENSYRFRYDINNKIKFSITRIASKYKTKQKFFHKFKDKLICCLFCGGKKCKYENYLNNKNNSITGLHSNYITPELIASQRPSDILIHKYNLIQVFKELNIGLIVNLQREGEHPNCGPNANNLTFSGYSYNPSLFSSNDIMVKLSGWKKMEVSSNMNFMLEIIKKISTIIKDNKKKVLIHCHSGFGRTGVVIVCYLLYINTDEKKNSDIIIKEVRKQRNKCVEKKSQINYCKKFEEFLITSRMLFTPNKEKIEIFIKRQEDILFGNELKKYGCVPKIIIKCLEKILINKEKFNIDNKYIYEIIIGEKMEWNKDLEELLFEIKNLINKNNWVLFENCENLTIIIELLYDWFEDSVEFVISPERTKKIITSDIFEKYINECYTNEQKNQINKKKLFDYIHKIYLVFESVILYTMSSFFSLIYPKDEDEVQEFNKVIKRISFQLLGFIYGDCLVNLDNKDIIEPLVNGLTEIMKIICNHLIENNNNDNSHSSSILLENDDFLPKKKFRPFSFVNNYNTSSNFFSKINNKPIQNFNNYTKMNINIYDNKSNKEKDKNLLQIYEILQKHFENNVSNNNCLKKIKEFESEKESEEKKDFKKIFKNNTKKRLCDISNDNSNFNSGKENTINNNSINNNTVNNIKNNNNKSNNNICNLKFLNPDTSINYSIIKKLKLKRYKTITDHLKKEKDQPLLKARTKKISDENSGTNIYK